MLVNEEKAIPYLDKDVRRVNFHSIVTRNFLNEYIEWEYLLFMNNNDWPEEYVSTIAQDETEESWKRKAKDLVIDVMTRSMLSICKK
jgi:hypothetical protein